MDFALKVISYLPVCPDSWGMHLRQAPNMAYFRPGQWVQTMLNLQTNWAHETWIMQDVQPAMIVKALAKSDQLTEQKTNATNPALRKAEFLTHVQEPAFWQAFFFTPGKRWLDVCEVRLVSEGTTVTADAHSCSTGIVPTAVFGCTVLSALLFVVPFSDFGQNKTHLRTLRSLLESEGIAVEVLGQKKDAKQS